MFKALTRKSPVHVFLYGVFMAAFILFIGCVNAHHAAAFTDCTPDPSTPYIQTIINVKILNADNSLNKYSSNFSIVVAAKNPEGYNFSPANPIHWTGHPSSWGQAFDYSTAGTLCNSGFGGIPSIYFGDGTDGHPVLDCLGGVDHRHNVSFNIGLGTVGDAGPGHIVDGFFAMPDPKIGTDLNHSSFTYTFVYQLNGGGGGSNTLPKINVDGILCSETSIFGWAYDPDTKGTVSRVDFYDGKLGAPGTVGLGSAYTTYQPGTTGTETLLPANSRFQYNIMANPSLFSGTHEIYAYAIDTSGTGFTEFHYTLNYLASCPGGVPSYTITTTPVDTASLDGDSENPTDIKLNSSVSMDNGPYTVSVTRDYYYLKAGNSTKHPVGPGTVTADVTDSFTYPVVQIDDPVGTLGLKTGDSICVSTSVNPHVVTRSADGTDTINDGNYPDPTDGCAMLVNKPYVSVFGGDVRAGGNFGDGVCSTPGSITTSLSPVTNLGGGTQLAALAIGSIQNFNTATSESAPQFGSGLAFANSDSDGNPLGTLGGYTTNNCIHDYFYDVNSLPPSHIPDPPVPPIYANVRAADQDDAHPGVHNFDCGPGLNPGDPRPSCGFPNGSEVVYYYKGDFRIGANIINQLTSRSSRQDIPSVTIVVQGNISIVNTVSEIDANLIAIPSGGTATPSDGIIHTCTTDSSISADPWHSDTPYDYTNGAYDLCNTQLTIKGALIANQVKFERTFGSVRDAISGEKPGGPAHSCGGSERAGSPAVSASVCAAEIIQYTPETWLKVPQPTDTKKDKSANKYITSLPPIL